MIIGLLSSLYANIWAYFLYLSNKFFLILRGYNDIFSFFIF